MSNTSNARTKLLLVLSIGIGLISATLFFSMLRPRGAGEAIVKPSILVAKHDLPAGSRLDIRKDLDELEVSPDVPELIQRGLASDRRAALEGQVLTRAVPAGTPIWYSDLTTTRTLDLAPGKLALAVPVRGSQGVTTLLDPGDRVKLMVTRSITRPSTTNIPAAASAGAGEILSSLMGNMSAQTAGEWRTEVLSEESFRVLAIGRRTAKLRQQIILGSESDRLGAEQAQSITLEVTQSQAQVILEKCGAGQLPLTLLLVGEDRPLPETALGN